MLRNFTDLGGRLLRKEAKELLYNTKTDLNLEYYFLRFTRDLGFKTERIYTRMENNLRRE